MKTPPATPVTPSHPDWLNDCSFQSRQDSPGLIPGILSHHVKKPASPPSFPRNFSSAGGVTDLGEHGLVPITKQGLRPVVEPQSATHSTSKLPTARNSEVLSELRTLRQLSAGVFDPQTSRDFLPESILFGLIGVLCAAWPIISMFSTMAARH
jgi:hypothetical protein